MRIGIDFDNTLVCYDEVFHEVGVAHGLIPLSVGTSKAAVKAYLESEGKGGDWTALQGHVYGPEILAAQPFPGAEAFLRRCAELGIEVCLVSHKTLRSVKGPKADLHAWARKWLDRYGFTKHFSDVVFDETREGKLARIGELGCELYIDDHLEVLASKRWPVGVRKVLFDPHDEHASEPYERVTGWDGATRLVEEAWLLSILPPLLGNIVPESADDVRLTRLEGGGNNRVYEVAAGKRRFLLKHYHRHPSDARDRLAAEYGFVDYARRHGIRAVPEPLARDPAHGLGLYAFVEGERPEQATAAMVDEAIAFFKALNEAKGTGAGKRLGEASDACFSMADHIARVERRFDRLKKMETTTPLEEEASMFVERELVPAWERVKGRVERGCKELRVKVEDALPEAERCLSPSDFGFHNSLMTKEGTLVFLDFEYAGWDDPAKMVCDFLLHPGMRLPEELHGRFRKGAVGDWPRAELLDERIGLLLPLHAVKWCCIMLNEFLPGDRERRRFADAAGGQAAFEQRQREQLDKARAALSEILGNLKKDAGIAKKRELEGSDGQNTEHGE